MIIINRNGLLKVMVVLFTVIMLGSISNKVDAAEKRELKIGQREVVADKVEEEFILNINEYGMVEVNVSNIKSGKWSIYVYDSNYNIISSSINGMQLHLTPGKYFVKVVNTYGMLGSCDLTANFIENIGYRESDKISFKDEVYQKTYKLNINRQDVLIETFSNEDDNMNTVLTLYDNNMNLIASNDDISSKCKFSKIIANIKASDTYYIKLENKDKSKPISAGIAINSNNSNIVPYIDTVAPKANGYLLNGEEFEFKVYASVLAESVLVNYKGMEYNKEKQLRLGTLMKDEKSNTFKGAILFTGESNFLEPYYINGKYESPKFVITAHGGSQGPGSQEFNGYITMENRQDYSGNDSSWYYKDELNHSFIDFATPNYECLSYAQGVNDQLTWGPRMEIGYGINNVRDYLSSTVGRPGKISYRTFQSEPLKGANLIFYNRSHVAVVTEYDKNGYPSKVRSKWGQLEVIESDVSGLEYYNGPMVYVGSPF